MKRSITNVIPATKIGLQRDQFFSYLPPEGKKTYPGQLVKIPLGHRQVYGVVHSQETKDVPAKLKPIKEIVEASSVLTPQQLQLAEWMSKHYLTSLGLVIKAMLPKRSVRPPQFQAQPVQLEEPHHLTDQQRQALNTIKKGRKPVTVLHGITGSGKTEVYLQAIAGCIAQGKQAIVLIPEISLTPQTTDRFVARFGSRAVAILNSRMAYGKRYREWLRIRNQKAKVVIGPRSAIFAPVQKLGLVVIDEEHETSYKQWDQHPRYHAREVAIKYARITNTRVVLGSATPSIETYYQARRGKFNLAKLTERINQAELPPVQIVDMRQELAAGNRSILSESLQSRIKEVLDNKQQAILFINRRGASTFVMCRDCGYVVECPDCSVSMTYHWQNGQHLLCHHCGRRETSPTRCPECDSEKIRYFGAGTQRVEAEIAKVFPRARIARMDTDTTRGTDDHSKIFRSFAAQEYDILIGTQMIAKGFDLPNIALVGIISADTGLNFPDFRAHERTFQLLTQVAGRTSRRDNNGLVILQTYHPKNAAIKAAAKHDFDTFYKAEISNRRKTCYPPFADFIKLTLTGKDDAKIKAAATELAGKLRQEQKGFEVLGPAPALVEKVQGRFSWHVLIKTIDKKMPPALKKIKDNWTVDVSPLDLLS